MSCNKDVINCNEVIVNVHIKCKKHINESFSKKYKEIVVST